MNLTRRHLNESQRAMVAAKIATMKRGYNPPIGGTSTADAASLLNVGARTDLASIDAKSQSEAADLLNVGRASVQRAAEVIDHGAPSVQRAVEKGDLSVYTAEALSKLRCRYPAAWPRS